MTQEEKELLLRDLCARLPYRVYISPVDCGKAILIGIKDGNPLLWDTIHKKEYDKPWDIEYIKPYLRPLSSMTEEEKEKVCLISQDGNIEYHYGVFYRCQDYLNSIHVDYRGLIEKGLAVEAPAGMYNLNKE